MVWSDGERRQLGAFGQFGHVDPDGSTIQHYYGAGLIARGWFAQRPDDTFGGGVAWVRFRGDAGDGVRGGGEVAVEAFYRAQLTPWLSLMPDVQYLHDPGGRPEVRDALVLTLRFEVIF